MAVLYRTIDLVPPLFVSPRFPSLIRAKFPTGPRTALNAMRAARWGLAALQKYTVASLHATLCSIGPVPDTNDLLQNVVTESSNFSGYATMVLSVSIHTRVLRGVTSMQTLQFIIWEQYVVMDEQKNVLQLNATNVLQE